MLNVMLDYLHHETASVERPERGWITTLAHLYEVTSSGYYAPTPLEDSILKRRCLKGPARWPSG